MILSQIMIAELLYIAKNPIDLSRARILHQTTLKSLLKRKLIARFYNRIECTQAGYLILQNRELNKRKYEADVSDSVKSLLHVSKILQMRKAS